MPSHAPGPAARLANQVAVLRALHALDEPTVTELMERTELSRPTVHAVCDQLTEANLVREVEPRVLPATRGRRPRSFALNTRAAHLVGVDLGVASVRVVVTDLRGETRGEAQAEGLTYDTPARERIAAAHACIDEALGAAGITRDAVLTVGVGLPAPVRPDGRLAATGGYLADLPELDVAAEIAGDSGWTVLVENDANLAALAELRQGAAQDAQHLVAILAGERLGAGIMVDRRLVRGATGATGELSFATLLERVPGAYGVGTLAREAALGALASASPERSADLLARCDGDPAQLTGKHVFDAAAAGDPLAREVMDEAAEPIARLIVVLQLLLDPGTIVISGAVANAPGLLEAVRRHLPDLPENAVHPATIVASTLGGRVVATGAAVLAIDDFWHRLSTDPHSVVPRLRAPAS